MQRRPMSEILFRGVSCLFSKSHDRWLEMRRDETKRNETKWDKTKQNDEKSQDKARLYRLLFVYHLQLIIQLLSWVWKFRFNTYHSTPVYCSPFTTTTTATTTIQTRAHQHVYFKLKGSLSFCPPLVLLLFSQLLILHLLLFQWRQKKSDPREQSWPSFTWPSLEQLTCLPNNKSILTDIRADFGYLTKTRASKVQIVSLKSRDFSLLSLLTCCCCL